ncbi:F-box/kelch-repeat protein At1g80440-like [Bidens hawaiensis]|uniref:F-box/kelch-repeat protein At1g80440-like n=1 Tax=Bidens hawaiensis TaxID=980011 RepID=UPI00404B9261
MELIPGLPNDVSLECLIRLPYTHLLSAVTVCRSWHSEILLPSFRHRRKSAGLSRHVIVMVQSQTDPNRKSKSGLSKNSGTPVYRLTVYDPVTGCCTGLPEIPGFSNGLPLFCRVASVGFNLVVMGGLNPENWEACSDVYVYNFASATWRRGRDMPGSTRLFFGCASDNERRVVVAGGHDTEKNALRSGMMYDVAEDKWTLVADMANERDECKVVFHRGKFYVIGGYETLLQGQFGKSAEAFDPCTWQWDPMVDDFLRDDMCPRTCVDGGNGTVYMYHDGEVATLNYSSTTRIPNDMNLVSCMIKCGGRLLVIGSDGSGGSLGLYVLDMRSSTWIKADIPEEYSGHIQSGCCLKI